MRSAIRRNGRVVVVVRRAEAGAPQSPNAVERIGYTRVSTVAQTLDQQEVAIPAAGVTKIFSNVMSGARDDRPGLAELLAYVRPGDSVIV
jgi:Resolvase, N terminal domain